MKLFASLILFTSLSVVSPSPATAADTIVGEVLDMACFIPKGAKGPAHAKCAKSCAERGMPLGLLTDDNQVYLLYPKHGREGAFDTVKKLAGAKAKLSGKVTDRLGMKGLEVHEATAAN